MAYVPREATQDQNSDKSVETSGEMGTEPAEPEVTINNSEVSTDKPGEKSSEQSSADEIKVIGVGVQSNGAYLKDKFMLTYLSYNGKETTIRVEGGALGDNMTVSGGILTNKGEAYNAKSLSCTMYDGIASITSVFPTSGDFENASLVLTINGEDVKLPLRDTFLTGGHPRDNSISIKHTASSDLEIYLDGKRITDEELKALDPATIASIDVNKQSNLINITSK